MLSDKIQNVTLYWITIQGSVDNLCKEKKGEQNFLHLFHIFLYMVGTQGSHHNLRINNHYSIIIIQYYCLF